MLVGGPEKKNADFITSSNIDIYRFL